MLGVQGGDMKVDARDWGVLELPRMDQLVYWERRFECLHLCCGLHCYVRWGGVLPVWSRDV